MDDLKFHMTTIIIIFVIFYFMFIRKGKYTEKLRKTLLPKSMNDMRMMEHNQELAKRIDILEDQYSKLIEKLDYLIDKLEGDKKR